MNFAFLKSKKVQKMGVLGIVLVIVFSFVNYYHHKKDAISTVPSEVQNDASKLDPDKRFASRWSVQPIQKDPVSDSTSQKLMGTENKTKENEENKPQDQSNSTQTQTNQPSSSAIAMTTSTPTSTSVVTTSGTQITTSSTDNSAILAKNIFTSNSYGGNGKIKDTPIMMRTALVSTETKEEQRLSNGQENKESFASNISNSNRNMEMTNLNSNKSSSFPKTKYDLLLAANSGGLVQLKGRDTSIGGADYQIKSGMRVLAFLPDKLIVTSAASQPTSLYVIGPMDKFTFPQGYVITATAKLNATEDRIDIESNYCSSSQNTNKSVPCVGTIKGVDGTTGLSGEIYNETMWSAIAAFATSSLAAIPLSQITQTSTSYGPVQNVSVANSINTALAAGIQSIGQSIQKGFDKSGTQISIPQGSVVQILFTQDVIL